MSYGQIFKRISRMFQSTVHSILSDEERQEAQDFDDELNNARQNKGKQSDNRQKKQNGDAGEPAGEGKRRPGEKEIDYYFSVLGLTPSASNKELKTAYHKLMSQYHPDRVATLGPELQKSASEKSKAINEAYMIIERRRGLK
jgi:DnaJ-domain-containing protein 1